MMISRRLLLLSTAASLPGFPLAQATLHKASENTTPKGLPDRLDLSPLMTPVKNQGNRDTCAYFSTVAILESTLRQRLGREVVLSEEFLIHTAGRKQKRVTTEVTDIRVVLNAAKEAGCVREDQWPYRRDLFGKGQICEKQTAELRDLTPCFVGDDPPAALYQEAQKLRLTKATDSHRIGADLDYGKDYASAPQYVNLLMQTMVKRQQALIAVICDPEGSYEAWRNGEVTVPLALQNKSEKELKKLDTHVVAFTGFDRQAQMFYFKNSWGTDWGDKGYGRISFDVLTTPFFGDAHYLTGGFISQPLRA